MGFTAKKPFFDLNFSDVNILDQMLIKAGAFYIMDVDHQHKVDTSVTTKNIN
jgi:hypothetical protein